MAGLLLLLAGCGELGEAPGYRNPEAPIAATTRFEPARFAGTYYVVAAFAAEGQAPHALPVSYAWDGTAETFAVGGPGAPEARFAPLEVIKPGRLRPVGRSNVEDEIWVLWTDADYRTVVISDRAGTFGQILDRSPGGLPDRIAAARDILDWYGFDLSKLEMSK
ncbi:lipocalin [Sulfitobacter sp. BDSS02]|nr:lipocalin [Sulfitobacter sp. BDSS02]MBR9849140.1 lipocalin [Paracoccaceae bacterium]